MGIYMGNKYLQVGDIVMLRDKRLHKLEGIAIKNVCGWLQVKWFDETATLHECSHKDLEFKRSE